MANRNGVRTIWAAAILSPVDRPWQDAMSATFWAAIAAGMAVRTLRYASVPQAIEQDGSGRQRMPPANV